MKNFNIKKLKNWFDWTPTDVTAPVAMYAEYKDVEKYLLGYNVTVSYKYHKAQTYSFPVDENKFMLMSREKALKRANKYYQKIKNKIEQDKKLQKQK